MKNQSEESVSQNALEASYTPGGVKPLDFEKEFNNTINQDKTRSYMAETTNQEMKLPQDGDISVE